MGVAQQTQRNLDRAQPVQWRSGSGRQCRFSTAPPRCRTSRLVHFLHDVAGRAPGGEAPVHKAGRRLIFRLDPGVVGGVAGRRTARTGGPGTDSLGIAQCRHRVPRGLPRATCSRLRITPPLWPRRKCAGDTAGSLFAVFMLELLTPAGPGAAWPGNPGGRFQSTPPREGRHECECNRRYATKFQSTPLTCLISSDQS
jgi:hypothetical protein